MLNYKSAAPAAVNTPSEAPKKKIRASNWIVSSTDRTGAGQTGGGAHATAVTTAVTGVGWRRIKAGAAGADFPSGRR